MAENSREERRAKFAGMNRQEKLEYIWQYYKAAVMGAAAVLFVLIYLIANPREPQKEINVNLTFLGDAANLSGGDEFMNKLQGDVPELFAHGGTVDIQVYALGPGADPMAVMGNTQKLAALMMSSDIDVIVGDASQLRKYSGGNAYLPLEELYTPEELAGMDIISYEYQPVYEDGSKDEAYTVEYVNLSGKSALTAMIPADELGGVVMSNSRRTKAARILLDYLMALN